MKIRCRKLHFLHSRLLLPLLFCLAILPVVSSLAFTEIMYNPSGNDNNHEFVEMYSNDTIDLSLFVAGDLKNNDSMMPLLVVPMSNYYLIIEEGFNYTGLNCSIYTIGKSIGDDLDNSGDTIIIYEENGSVVASLSYNNTLANGNGRSLHWINNTWEESLIQGGTPCQENYLLPQEADQEKNKTKDGNSSLPPVAPIMPIPPPMIEDPISNLSNSSRTNITLEFIIQNVLYTGVNYTSLFKITNFDYKQGDNGKNITFNYTVKNFENPELYREDSLVIYLKSTKKSEIGYFFSENAGNYLICGTIDSAIAFNPICKDILVLESSNITCDASITSFTDALNYTIGQKVEIFHSVSFNDSISFPYTIEYWIEDVYGNIVKKISETKTTTKKTWTIPERNELQIYFLKSNLTVLCNNTNSLTNAQHLFYVKGERLEDSSLTIDGLSIPKEGISFGESIKGKIHLYKGNTTRSSVHFYVTSTKGKKISDIIKLNFPEKYKEALFDISIKLFDDCKLEEGDYFFVAEGLGLSSKKIVTITRKNTCAEIEALEEKDQRVFIKSFYTKTKKIGNQIKLYATIHGNETVDLLLYNHDHKELRTVDLRKENTFMFLVNVSEGNNLYLLHLLKDNRTLESKELEVTRQSFIQHIEQKIPVQGYIQNKKYLQILKEKIYDKGDHLVYISKNGEQKRYLPYFFIGFLAVLSVGILFIFCKEK